MFNLRNIADFLKKAPVSHTLDAFVSGTTWELTAAATAPALANIQNKALYNISFGAITGLAAAVAGTVITCLTSKELETNEGWKPEYWGKIGKVLLASFGPEFLWQLVNWALEELNEVAELNEAEKYTIGSLAFFAVCALSFHSISHLVQADWKSWQLSGVVGLSSASFFGLQHPLIQSPTYFRNP